MQYHVDVPGITVAGSSFRAFFDALKGFSVLHEAILATMGVPQLVDDEWYPMEKVMVAYQKVDALLGGRGLERFGKLAPARAQFPPGIHDVYSLFDMLDAGYHLNHRRDGVPMLDLATGRQLEGIGHYRHECVSERECVMVCDTPYPCRFDLGLYQGFIGLFEASFTVVHEPGSCRARGELSCAYRARW